MIKCVNWNTFSVIRDKRSIILEKFWVPGTKDLKKIFQIIWRDNF